MRSLKYERDSLSGLNQVMRTYSRKLLYPYEYACFHFLISDRESGEDEESSYYVLYALYFSAVHHHDEVSLQSSVLTVRTVQYSPP
jgi:hypothetical protein